jgi:hypothetical protein
VQHGSFLKVLDGPADEILIYTDGDMVMQRQISADELDWLNGFDDDTVSAGWNQPGETLTDCVRLIQPKVPMGEIGRRFPGELNRWPSLNVGVLAMRRSAWEQVYTAYLERWELAGQTFEHQARQQWLICYVIFYLGMDFQMMPYSFHMHGHFGLKPGMEMHGQDAIGDGRLAVFKHYL